MIRELKHATGLGPKLVLVAAIGLFSAASASAAPIAVTNFSFETLPPGGLPFGCGAGCSFSAGVPVPGWTGSLLPADMLVTGEFRPGTDVSNFTYFNTLSDGFNDLYTNAVGNIISQTVGPTVVPGLVYTLLVDLGHRNDQSFTASADLLINGVAYVAVGVAPLPGFWSTYVANYIGSVADAGQAITIELRSTGAQANFDNVRLSGDPTPEPASLLLLGTGLVVAARRWRKRGTNA